MRLLLPASRNFVLTRARIGSPAAMTRRPVGDSALLALYAIGACAIGAFVAVFDCLGFRLTSARFDLGLGAAGLVFLVNPIAPSARSSPGGWPTGTAAVLAYRSAAWSPWPVSC